MSLDVRTLRRVLRQLADAGCRDVLLQSITADQALRLARAARAREGAAGQDAAGREPAVSAVPTAAAPADSSPPAQPVVPGSAAARLREALAAAGVERAGPAAAQPRRRGPAGAAVSAGLLALTADPAVANGPSAAEAALRALLEPCTVCRACRLHESRRNVVFGEGSATADVVVVGEAPGQEEDRTGRPFVGRAGRLLDLLLMTAGFARESVYICNVLKCRPPQNRNPLPDEVAQCTTTFLHPQLDAIAPKVLIAVGKFAAQALLASEESIGRLRGRIHAYRGTPLIVTYHPAFLLRSPQMCRVAWHDFQLLRQVYDEQG